MDLDYKIYLNYLKNTIIIISINFVKNSGLIFVLLWKLAYKTDLFPLILQK